MHNALMETYVLEQAKTLAGLLQTASGLMDAARRMPRLRPRKVWLAGSGTSLYAAMIAARFWRRFARVDAEAISSLELLNDTEDWQLGADTVVIGISQSGATVTLSEALDRAKRLGSLTIAVTAEPNSNLARQSDVVVHSQTGPEEVFAKTKGFTSTALAACLFGYACARLYGLTADEQQRIAEGLSRLPAAAEAVSDSALQAGPALVERFRTVDGLFVVGTGTMVPAAYEGALKLLEVGKLPVLGRELEEVLHGYFNAIGPETGVVLLAGRIPQVEKIHGFIEAVRHVNGPLVVVAEQEVGGIAADLVVPALGCSELAPLLGVIPMQVMAYELARTRGINPNVTRYPELYSILKTKTIYF